MVGHQRPVIGAGSPELAAMLAVLYDVDEAHPGRGAAAEPVRSL